MSPAFQDRSVRLFVCSGDDLICSQPITALLYSRSCVAPATSLVSPLLDGRVTLCKAVRSGLISRSRRERLGSSAVRQSGRRRSGGGAFPYTLTCPLALASEFGPTTFLRREPECPEPPDPRRLIPAAPIGILRKPRWTREGRRGQRSGNRLSHLSCSSSFPSSSFLVFFLHALPLLLFPAGISCRLCPSIPVYHDSL